MVCSHIFHKYFMYSMLILTQLKIQMCFILFYYFFVCFFVLFFKDLLID